MNIKTKRAYEAPAQSDGTRYLVDRFWPRGKKREDLNIRAWLKDVAPSPELCKWFGHNPERWIEFRERYFTELDANSAAWQPLLEVARNEPVTLIFGAKDTEHNQAAVLKEYLENKK